MGVFMFALFTSLVMTIGVLTVCFNSPKTSKSCQMTFKRMSKSSIISNSQPRSVAVGDLNNDSQIDIVVANSGTHTIGILLAYDNGTFAEQKTYLTGSQSHPYSIVINYFNKDNYLDIAVANYGTNNIGIFLGYANGTFANQTVFSTGSSRPLFITAGDFNNDKKTDIAVANYGTDSIGILLGYGNGSFQLQTIYSTAYHSLSYSMAVGDFDNNNHLDIAVANYGTDNIGILLGYGNGSFTNQQTYTTGHGSNPSSVVVGDINNDNHSDIVVANNGTGNVGVLLGFGNGTFSAQTTYSIDFNFHPEYIAIGNFNKDNKLDVVVVVDKSNDQIHILSAYSNDTFDSVTTYDAINGSSPISVAVVDLNNDNQSDIVVANYGTNSVLTLIGYTSEPSVRQKNYFFGYQYHPPSVVAADFNNDNHLDIAITGVGKDGVLLMTGYGNGTFLQGKTFSTGNQSIPQTLYANDLNNDNRMDIVTTNPGSDSVGVLLGWGDGNFANVTTYSLNINSNTIRLAVYDVNNDTQLDIITANRGTDSIGILLGYGNGSFATVVTYSTGIGTNPLAVAIGDIDNDNHADILTANYQSDSISILFGGSNGTFGMLRLYVMGYVSGPMSIALADFDSNNYLDIVITNYDAGNIGVILGFGNGSFEKQTTYSTGSGSSPMHVRIADFNQDKRSDIAVTLSGNDKVIILFGYGNGSFPLARTYFTGYSSRPYGIAVADLNNDRHLEIVVTLAGVGKIAILTEYFAAKFANQTSYSTGSAPQPYSIVIGDLNNDNQSDIIVANSGTDNLGIVFGLGNGTFESQIVYSTGVGSRPHYVIVGDLNKDNHLDIVAINSKNASISVIMGYGNGTFEDQIVYPAPEGLYPTAIVLGDLNSDNRSDLLIINTGVDSITILFGYEYSLFESQRPYGSANTLGPYAVVTNDFNNDTFLDIAAAFYNSGNVGILLGSGNGSFRMMMTYPQRIGSRLTALAVDDVNSDGKLDIIIADYGTNNVIILLGYANESFANSIAFSTTDKSGPSAVAVADFNKDNRLDIVVTNTITNNIGILLGYGNGSFATIVTYSTGDGSFPVSLTISDLNKDDQLDVLVVNRDTSNVGIFLGYGNGSFANQVTYPTGYYSSPQSIVVSDLDSDGQLDINIAIPNPPTIGFIKGYGDGTFGVMQEYLLKSISSPRYITIGDLNNDNRLDIVVVNDKTNNVVVLFGFGHGVFYIGREYSTGIGSGPIALVIGDFNNDGRSDFAVANYLSNDIGIFLAHGTEPFGGIVASEFHSRTQPQAVAITDFNNDGLLDVVVANYGIDNVGILLGHGTDHFNSMTTYFTGVGSGPCSVAVGDFNNDNHSDVVVTNCETNDLIILLLFRNGSFTGRRIYSTGDRSRPCSVAIADFNNDNIMDIVVANSGTNNILLLYGYGNGSFGNRESYPLGYDYRPYSIAVNDLNQDGWMDIVVACYNTDNVEILMKMC